VEVMGELCKVWFEIVGVQLLEGDTDTPVQLDSPSGREFVVERVADEYVREAHPPWQARNVCDDSLRGGLVEKVEELIAADIAHALESREVELPSEHRREKENETAALRQVPQTAPDHRSYALRDHSPPGLGVGNRRERLFARHQPDYLPDEERIPFCGTVKGADHVTVWVEAGALRHEAGHFGLGQPAQRDALRDALSSELSKRLREWI